MDLWEMYEDLADLPELGPEEESANHPYAQDLRRYQRADELTEEKIRRMRQGYYALVTHVDRQIGRLVDAWERLGLAENTVLTYERLRRDAREVWNVVQIEPVRDSVHAC